MDANRIMQILKETAYVRTGGSPEELQCARYLQACCAELGLQARLEPFPVEMGSVQRAELWCDGVSLPCTGYNGALPGDIEAPFYYLSNTDPWSLEQWTEEGWVSAMPEDTFWTTVAYSVPQNDVTRWDISWSLIREALEPGTYRIGKYFTATPVQPPWGGVPGETVEETVYAEFTIE